MDEGEERTNKKKDHKWKRDINKEREKRGKKEEISEMERRRTGEK